jgi:hypothetical protein
MEIIILVIIIAIILIICNNYRNNKEDYHNIYNGYINPYIQQPLINPYVQQPILFPIYSPYRRYYLLNSPYTPNMFAPYYSQYDILNRKGIYY